MRIKGRLKGLCIGEDLEFGTWLMRFEAAVDEESLMCGGGALRQKTRELAPP
jgi:hypothetical protein